MLQFGTGGWRAVIADGFTKANLRLLAAGLLYIDLCANDTILSAKGIVYPYIDRLIGLVDERLA